jgi:hypothetical protein
LFFINVLKKGGFMIFGVSLLCALVGWVINMVASSCVFVFLDKNIAGGAVLNNIKVITSNDLSAISMGYFLKGVANISQRTVLFCLLFNLTVNTDNLFVLLFVPVFVSLVSIVSLLILAKFSKTFFGNLLERGKKQPQ